MSSNIAARIQHFNRERNPQLLELKYTAMRSDISSFYRGTSHIFYEDFPKQSPLNTAPPVWVCGDLHLQNFGTYKADNRLVYFDINDFDEAALAPCTWELTRFLTSVLVACPSLGMKKSEALSLCDTFLDTYIHTLAKGQIRIVETETAIGLVKELLESLKQQKRKDFLAQRTQEKKGKRLLIIDNKRIAEANSAQQQKVTKLLKNWVISTQQDADFFQVLDVQRRIAGTGSLGLERYIILVEGKGSPDHNYILDFKQAQKSSLEFYLTQNQPQWSSQAARIVAIEQWMQGIPPALLGVVIDEEKSYVLRELQPTADKVDLKTCNGKFGRLEKLMQTMAQVTAWDELRSSGRQGSTITDELIKFANSSDWRNQILDYAKIYSEQVELDYQEFCQSKLGQ
jgi:uncharacterized protein (DUF2252 family)